MNLKTFGSRSSALLFVSAVALFSSPLAFSGGYEKPDFFSAQWAPLGGAAASSVSGAESVYFNPAGLAGGDGTLYATGNFSPTIVHFSGPLAGTPDVQSNNSFVPAYGAFASFKPTDSWGIGIGTYLAGGSRAIYDNVDFSNSPTAFGAPANSAFANSGASVQSDISIVEFAIATAYEVLDGFRLGIEWRISHVSGKFSSYAYDPIHSALLTTTLDDIGVTRVNGFRLGAQYYPRDSRWGLGAVWRTSVNFRSDVTVESAANLGTGALTQANSTGTVENAFPQAFDIGGHYDLIPNGLRAHLQYTFTNYSVNQNIGIAGTVNTPLGPQALTGIVQAWTNEHDIRVGLECFELADWVFRASYVWSSQVTPAGNARPTLLSPGNGNTVGIGAGTSWMDKHLDTNAAFEYGWTSGTVPAGLYNPAVDQGAGAAGDYGAHNLTLYLGASFHI